MTGAHFPPPGEYTGDPPPLEGLRQALARATDDELRLTMTMLAMGAKMAAGVGDGERVTEPLEGAAALFGWLSAILLGELERRARLFGELAADGPS